MDKNDEKNLKKTNVRSKAKEILREWEKKVNAKEVKEEEEK